MRGATCCALVDKYAVIISIHAPHAGRDLRIIATASCRVIFQSTRPMRGATEIYMSDFSEALFQSTRPMRGATPRASRS